MGKTLEEARLEVARLYVASFARVADSGGLNYWVSAYLNGLSLKDMANDFMQSLEGKTKYPSFMTNSEFLDAIYQNVFGRASDGAGKAFWEAALVAGTPRATFIATIISAALANGSTDGAMLNNKASYGVYCAVNQIDSTVAAATLLTITSDSSTLTNASKANLSFVLTTGTDGLSGGAGNDSFSGSSTTSQTTDAIKGEGGTDTLTLTGTVTVPSLDSVEAIVLKNTSGKLDISSVSALTSVTVDSPNGNGDFLLSSQTFSIKSASTPRIYNLKYAASAKTFDLTVEGVGSSTTSKSTVNLAAGTALATVNVTASNGASYILLENSGYSPITKLTIAGESPIFMDISDTSATKLKTIDASTNSGGVTLGLANMADFAYSVVGGLGADTFNFGNRLGADDKVEGGSLADTIQVIGTATSTTDGNLKSVEYITLSGETLLTLTSQTENFVITGSSYNDTVVSGLGADTIRAGSGDDMIYVASGGSIYKIIDGGDGTDTIVVSGTFDKVGDSRVSNVEKIMLQKTSTTTTTTTTSTTGITVDISDQTEELIVISGSGNDTVTLGGGADTFKFASTVALNGEDTIKGFDISADSFDITAFLSENSVGSNTVTTAVKWGTNGLDLRSGKNAGVIYNKTTAFDPTADIALVATGTTVGTSQIALDDNGKALVLVTSDTDGIGDSVVSSYVLYFVEDTNIAVGTTFAITKVGTLTSSTEYNAANLANANFI